MSEALLPDDDAQMMKMRTRLKLWSSSCPRGRCVAWVVAHAARALIFGF